MPTTVEVPGLGTVEFPDGMNPQQMDVEIRKHLSSAGPQVPQLTGVEHPYVPNDFGATPPPTNFGPSSRDFAESISKGFGSKFIAGQMQPGVLKALAEQATPANALMARVLPEVMSSELIGIPLRALFGAAGAQAVGQAAGQRFSGVPQTEGEKSYLDAQMVWGGAQVAATPGLEKPVGALGSHLYETGRVLAGLRPSDAVTQPFRLGGGVPQQGLGQLVAGHVNPPVAQEAVPSPFDKGRLFPNVPKQPGEVGGPLPKNAVPVKIQTPQGVVEGVYHGSYWEAPGTDADKQPVISYPTPQGQWTTGALHPGDRVLDKIPSYDEWKNPKALQDLQHDLKSVVSAIRYGKENNTLTPEQIQQFFAEGDAIHQKALSGAIAEAKQSANDLWRKVMEINKKGAQNETASQKTPSAGVDQGSAQEDKTPTPSSPLQKTVPADVGAGVPSARGGVQQSTGGRVEPQWVKNILAIPEQNRNQGMREDLDNWMRGKPTNREQRDEGGFITFGGKINGLEALGWKGDTKVSGEQTFNRIRNLLGGDSAEFKYWNEAGLKSFLAVPRTQAEVKQWMEGNALKVEVRKFGEGGIQRSPNKLNTHNSIIVFGIV